MPDVPGTIKRKACLRCGGDLRAEEVEYKGIEWVCVSLCGARYTPDQLEKATKEKAATEKIQEGIARLKQNTEDADREAAVKTAEEIDQNDNRQPAGKAVTYIRGERKKARHCKSCHFFRKAGAETWCITKSCPSHYPRKLRPQYHAPSYKLDTEPPRELSTEEKLEIVEYAKAHTIKAAEKKYGIPWTLIRSLVASSERLKKAAGKEIETGNGDTPGLPPWNEAWGDPVKVEWLRSYREVHAGKE